MFRYFCHACLRPTEFKTIAGFVDGSHALECMECGGRTLSHSCRQVHHSQESNLLPIALGAMGVVCPECKLLYQVGEVVATFNPSAGATLASVALLLFGLVALDKLASRVKRR